ncbi:AtzE family amidohydrolase [Sphingomonas sp.]|uniref:AtzE family amidohydrolase n=1 Tax=Sphingomonas sp. TaxID=28214 RepID=UPI000DB2408A|nr:AtzE family amidohydrolase [Sphingomonas sp.]PZU08006.1 MAG: AtzE family amidohydrolase [Sphingomonas sp.]
MTSAGFSAQDIASAVRSGACTATQVVERTLSAISRRDPDYRSVTRLLADRAHRTAAAVDATVARGADPGPLAGVPFGVKDLFDVAGLPTTAGAAMRRDAPPAQGDAPAIRRLEEQGAILVATLNMDEFAYGFATINAHYGTTRNPHDITRLAGGSSGGSAAAVAGGLLPLTLGSDTNGSIRVPASLTGIYGLKPTHGALPMEGVFPFVESFDDIGPFATSIADLHLAWRALGGGADAAPPGRLRVARLGGWFRANIADRLLAAIDEVAVAAGGDAIVELPKVDVARSAAFLMTAAEGGALHAGALARSALAFDPATRDRLAAGCLLPQTVERAARRFRVWFAGQAADLFARHDVLIAPATPDTAPTIADPMIEVDGRRVAARAQLGLYTQPLSFIGLPVIAAPLRRTIDGLPLGIQLIGAPGREEALFALAARLEADGLIGAPPLPPPGADE